MTKSKINYGSHAADATQKGKKKERFNDATFVNYELDEAARAACKKWDIDAAGLLQMTHEVIDRGYSITLKFDTYSDAYAVFMRPGELAKGNQGLILTGRGSTPAKALKQVFYKHFEVMAETWEFFVTTGRGADLDD